MAQEKTTPHYAHLAWSLSMEKVRDATSQTVAYMGNESQAGLWDWTAVPWAHGQEVSFLPVTQLKARVHTGCVVASSQVKFHPHVSCSLNIPFPIHPPLNQSNPQAHCDYLFSLLSMFINTFLSYVQLLSSLILCFLSSHCLLG